MNGFWIILGVIGAGLILLILNHDSGTLFGLQNNQFAHILYLGVWGAVIGAAILPRAGGLGAAARNAAIWLAIILLLMTVYVYRYDLQDIGSRMTAGLIPGSPVSVQTADGRDQVLIIRSSNGHFEARGAVNGEPISFLIDTGAGAVVLTHEDAEAAGIDTASLSYSVPVATANGVTTAAPVRIESLKIGDLERNRVQAMVARPNALFTSLLGMSFLETLWGFEIRGDRLILTD